MTRREQRIFVFNELYFYGFYDKESFVRQCELYLSSETEDPALIEELKTRATRVIENLTEIDDMINRTAIGWTTERMSKVDLSILRLAVFEAFFDEDIPESVAINEAVELAKKFSSGEAASFINGILGKLSKNNNSGDSDGKNNIPGQPG